MTFYTMLVILFSPLDTRFSQNDIDRLIGITTFLIYYSLVVKYRDL